MRKINRIVVHCTGTPPFTPVQHIHTYWREKLGWKNTGYHYIITANGEVVQLADEASICNGAKGYNHDSIHIAYVGGISISKINSDTRTLSQKESMFNLVRTLRVKYDFIPVLGHCDLPNVKKSCPNFNTLKWYIDEVEKEMKQSLK